MITLPPTYRSYPLSERVVVWPVRQLRLPARRARNGPVVVAYPGVTSGKAGVSDTAVAAGVAADAAVAGVAAVAASNRSSTTAGLLPLPVHAITRLCGPFSGGSRTVPEHAFRISVTRETSCACDGPLAFG